MSFYEDLEALVRKKIPSENYGYLGYLLSPEHGLILKEGRSPLIDGEFSFEIGYNCFDVNKFLFQLLEKLGKRPTFWRGEDALGVFKPDNHWFCRDKEGVIIDGVSLYPFTNAKHKPTTTFNLNSKNDFPISNPIEVLTLDNEQYVVYLSCGENGDGRTVSYNSGKKFVFRVNIKNLQTAKLTNYIFRIDLNCYRDNFTPNFDYLGTDVPTQGKLYSSGIKEVESLNDSPQTDSVISHYWTAVRALIHKAAYGKKVHWIK
ncbi:MAG TPA: hypothetical protein VJC39_01665 [Candidatus Nanoarchaeia archaeon]|nr:hypothetical protein [Candidatus Nanoarchaeia archaeon]